MSINGTTLTAAKVKEEVQKVETAFRKVWPTLLDYISQEPKFNDIPGRVRRLVDALERNVPFGKQTRAYLCIFMYRSVKPKRTEEEDFLNYVNGWMIEIFQAAALIADDIMDRSETRRGMSCWYKQDGVGLTAVNDASLMNCFVNDIAFKYLSGKTYFQKLLESSYNNSHYTVLGESLDLKVSGDGTPNFSMFTESTYKALVKYKTSYYTFVGPVTNALIRAGIEDEESLNAVEEITLQIGELFQIQDDFLDCYGDPESTGKVGTDIRDGKLSWLIVKALQLASKSELMSLQEHYGQARVEAEYIVKSIYDDLTIEELFYKHEDNERKQILTKIKALPSSIPQEPFLNVIDALYRRQK